MAKSTAARLLLCFAVLAVLVGCESSDVPAALENAPSAIPPSGLREKISELAVEMGDPDAEVWWTKTTGAVIDRYLEDESTEGWERNRPVYVVILHGTFTAAMDEPGPEGPYTWVLQTLGGASPTYPTETRRADYEPFPAGLALSKVET